MAWVWLIAAGIAEIVFAILLKHSEGFTRPLPTLGFLVAAAIAFYCLTRAMQTIPIGTAYTVWIGIGAIGVVLYGIVQLHEPVTAPRLALLSLLIVSIAGLKLTATAH